MEDDLDKINKPERITFKAVFNSILQVLNLERGIFYTLWVLTVRPGEAIREYIFEDRTKLTKPFGFLLLTIAIATYITITYMITEENMAEIYGGVGVGAQNREAQEAVQQFMGRFMEYYNIGMIMSVPFYALGSWLILKKPKFNLAEHLVINTYLFSYQTVLYILLCIPFYDNFMMTSYGYFTVVIIYSIYAYSKIFSYDAFEGGARGLLVALFSFFTYMIVFVLVMLVSFLICLKMGIIEIPKN